MRLGVLGGTFNPPHLGHLVAAQEAYIRLDLDRVMLIPARIPPHKAVEDEPGANHRLALCQAAVQNDERFTVSELELRREGASYTVDTLAELRTREPDSELYLIVGADIAAGLPQWHEPERVLSLATLAVAKRRGTSQTAVHAALAQIPGGERTTYFRMPRIGISSTLIRDRVKAGTSIRYLVPDAVANYIEQHHLYPG